MEHVLSLVQIIDITEMKSKHCISQFCMFSASSNCYLLDQHIFPKEMVDELYSYSSKICSEENVRNYNVQNMRDVMLTIMLCNVSKPALYIQKSLSLTWPMKTSHLSLPCVQVNSV